MSDITGENEKVNVDLEDEDGNSNTLVATQEEFLKFNIQSVVDKAMASVTHLALAM